MGLKSFREDKLNRKAQSEFEGSIGMDQSGTSQQEQRPSLTFRESLEILEKTGGIFEEFPMLKELIPKPLDIKNTWGEMDFTKFTPPEYISSVLQEMGIPEEYREAYTEDLCSDTAAVLAKPKVAIVERSDARKSALTNALLGTDQMHLPWIPMASIPVYIKHISDKPAFMEEDVWIFANQVGAENSWDEHKLYDEAYCRAWKIGAGGIEILHSLGTGEAEKAGAAVVFLDAPILRNCDIVHLPGFDTESEDHINFAAAQKPDVILYLSPANNFMRSEDIAYLKRMITELPAWEKKGGNTLKPLSNLFIIASQAYLVASGNQEQLKEILDAGCANLLKELPNGYWANREKLSGYAYGDSGASELRSRFFTYSIATPKICLPFYSALKEILEALPAMVGDRAKSFVRSYIKAKNPNLFREIVAKHEKYAALLSAIEKDEPSRAQDNDKRKKEVRNEIARLSNESIGEFSKYIAATINIEELVRLMEEKGVKNKKVNVALFGSSLQDVIHKQCEKILEAKSEIITEKAKEYVASYEKSIARPFEENGMAVSFDTGWIFDSALSAAGLFGGLAPFISEEIFFTGIVFKGDSLAVGAAISFNWEKSVAKKIVEVFEKKDFRKKFYDEIQEYWEQTEEAFDEAASELDKEWDVHVGELRKMVDGYAAQEM